MNKRAVKKRRDRAARDLTRRDRRIHVGFAPPPQMVTVATVSCCGANIDIPRDYLYGPNPTAFGCRCGATHVAVGRGRVTVVAIEQDRPSLIEIT